jgi:hypothetical protein
VEDFVAYPSRWRVALLTLGAFAFVTMGLWFVGVFGTPPMSHRYPPAILFVVGCASIIFFGSCGLLGAKRLFDTDEELRIGRSGIRWSRWSDETIPWAEISEVTTWSTRGQRFIILHLRNPALFPGKGVVGKLARANRALTGGDIGISLTATDRGFEEAMSAVDRLRPRTKTL